MAPSVSIILPAHNEEQYLGPTLEALRRQTRPASEILVVANGCTDHTIDVAQAHGTRLVQLESACACNAMNVGAQVAAGEILLFLDADICLAPQALEVLQRDFGPRRAVGTFLSRPSSPRRVFRALCALRNAAFRTQLYRSTIGAIVCWRQPFLAVGGFDPARWPRANRDLVRKLLPFGGYCCLRAPATVSTRRYERWGLARLTSFWLAAFLLSLVRRPPLTPYGDVR